ncbi:uncharacterized protein L3040_003576 [Drepanopeziza brunnea f. sp. 'multigermtubi']|uniref:MOSC domain-containing protein n=1 Tax=Marssonina brunnea f. sp. multigermtubi (strain MB_m1) TaxID=1072389 RepID=K1XY30_MARBU|nr:uncharacterized protein MBM_04063 [Drepanopeziza brunnea f. sp. 'multigermtubi' MB_m1]EKD17694.1 hypothetical protein MBM_04063 [Drepanopeziza brunnea f. sp. 'multigermtubi' MB_m1]KAJ5046331.1 hypothetical protein L3040_003576 [Drepanopeziza brunnea f. sp. 'multigermtubi']
MLESLNPFASPVPALAHSEVSELRIYPIKSCRGISVKKAYVTPQGLDMDRRWMFVDAETMKFITIRDISEMTLIDTSFAFPGSPGAEQLVISIRNTNKRVTLPARPTPSWLEQNTTLCTVNIWESDTDGYVYGSSINDTFTEFFHKPVKLVYKGPTPRILRGNGAPEQLGRVESTNFPDVLPVLVANEASLQELNGRLRGKGHEEITMERFRPNIVVRGASPASSCTGAPAPWSEDTWKTIRLCSRDEKPKTRVSSMFGGGATALLDIDIQARCARCQVPNVDPETAVKDRKEPWDTLVSYRRVDPGIKWKPCFGMLGCPRSEGEVSVGDGFEVLGEVKGEHVYMKGF